ncbi:MAG: alpha/beta fold hydrolase, partial [Candidatus Binatia bacterium]
MLVRANELNLSCTLSGPEDGLAVVFVHGLAASSSVWDEQARRFEVRHRVVRFDLRSHGGSDVVVTPCTRSDLVADLVGLLDGLNVESAVVVGHSAGGVVAMQTAIEAPGRVAGLVLVGTASECNDKT